MGFERRSTMFLCVYDCECESPARFVIVTP